MTLVLRPLAERDVSALRRIRAEPAVERWWDPVEDDFPLHDEPEATRLTVELDGAVAGMVQYGEELEPKYKSAWIDIFLDPAVHGRGVGTETVRRVASLLVRERGHHRIAIDPAVDNLAAVRAYEKAGFRPVGVQHAAERDADGRGWHDALMMELVTIGEHRRRLPERVAGDGLVLRRWRVEDAEALARAVGENLDHLRPWMPWIGDEPVRIADRRQRLRGWEADWERGGDVYLGIFSEAGEVLGSTGLHHRGAPDTLEIGYWVHRHHLREGIATRSTRLLTTTALDVPGIDAVEIAVDAANVASRAIPTALGFTAVAEREPADRAPAERGRHTVFRVTYDAWPAAA